MARMSAVDEQYMGYEPTLKGGSTQSEIARAYNWYNYFHDNDDAKKFVLDYLKGKGANTSVISAVSRADSRSLRSIGWNCRILTRGGVLPEDIVKKTVEMLQSIINENMVVKQADESATAIKTKVDHVAIEKIGDLEEILDKKNDFDVSSWLAENNVGPYAAKRIVEYYQPLREEIEGAISGKDDDLKEAYSNCKKTALKKKLGLIQAILDAAQGRSVIKRKPRKPRKAKAKAATKQVAKVTYMHSYTGEGLTLTSIDPTHIVGASQVWLYNTKTRNLTELNAAEATGFTVKGTTVQGFDERTSVTKKLRKPNEVLSSVLDGGKVALRKLMGTIRTKPGHLSGRLNADTIILRTIK